MKVTLKGGPSSGWYGPPKGTHSGEKHRKVGSGRTVVSKKPAPKSGLGTSPVKSTSEISAELRGANDATVVTFEDGSKALFKPSAGMDMGDVGSEVLAYEFSQSIGWELVPETTVTEIDGDVGSLQRWVPGSLDGYKFRDAHGKDKLLEVQRGREYTRMAVMDRLISNPDRHDGNFVVDKSGRAWAIDNGLAFSESKSMYDFKIYVRAKIPSKANLAATKHYSDEQKKDYASAYSDVAMWSQTLDYRDYVKSMRDIIPSGHADRLEYAVGMCRERYG